MYVYVPFACKRSFEHTNKHECARARVCTQSHTCLYVWPATVRFLSVWKSERAKDTEMNWEKGRGRLGKHAHSRTPNTTDYNVKCLFNVCFVCCALLMLLLMSSRQPVTIKKSPFTILTHIRQKKHTRQQLKNATCSWFSLSLSLSRSLNSWDNVLFCYLTAIWMWSTLY